MTPTWLRRPNQTEVNIPLASVSSPVKTTSHIASTPIAPQAPNDVAHANNMNHFEAIANIVSRRNQALIAILFFATGTIFIAICMALAIWLAVHGPAPVPLQDTRITAIIISSGTRLSGLFITVALVRSAWAAFLPHLLSGRSIPTRTLVGACRNFMSFGQWEHYISLPTSFKVYLVIAALLGLAFTGTSASFRYESLDMPGSAVALIPDIASACDPSLVNGSSYFCTGTLNANTTSTSWSYIDQVNSGGAGTVSLYGELGDKQLGANVTLAVLPTGWTLGNDSNLPWMSMGVSCQDLTISAEFTGTGISAIATIFVNDYVIDTLDVPNMPEWGGLVHLYQQVNVSGQPAGSLAPWIAVMLSRDLDDGTANFGGLAPEAITYLGNSYLDLHGYGPVLQGVLGAAAWCEFTGSTGGQWPNELWPPLNFTTNVVIGTVIDDRPTIATAMLNYGPSWQYNPVSENSLPGGSVSYIANNTGPGVTAFSDLFAAYIRNQWALMAYSVAPQSGLRIQLPFHGLGESKLYIALTGVSALPIGALAVGLLLQVYALVCTIRRRRWVNRVEFEGWWLVKALRADLYKEGFCNATEKDFDEACSESSVAYRDTKPGDAVGHLALTSLGQGRRRRRDVAIAVDENRVYGFELPEGGTDSEKLV